MANLKDILVITTSSVEGLKIKKLLKPVSAHIVAGTNIYSDFLGGLTDVLGGRSHTYQKQLTSLYNEAIEKIRSATYEIGGNCVIGLSIDLDEISGKGKSMFMITAVGTAVIIEKDETKSLSIKPLKNESVSAEIIHILRKKKDILEKANSGTLVINSDIWDFIITHKTHEIFNYLITKFHDLIVAMNSNEEYFITFNNHFTSYIDSLEDDKKLTLIYNAIKSDVSVAPFFAEKIKELYLFDFDKNMELLNNADFSIRKFGLQISTYDKLFYVKKDKEDLIVISKFIANNFEERGIRSTKKQILSSKEKEVWICECGKTNDIGDYCGSCAKDIYGFKQNEIKPEEVKKYINQKIELISEYLSE